MQPDHTERDPDEMPTLGGRHKRATIEIPSGGPTERPTSPAITPPDMPVAGRGAPSPDLPPPDHATAVALARAFLAGPYEQATVGRDGAEAIARRVIADDLDMQIVEIGRSCREGSASEAMIRATCVIALGIIGDLVPSERIEQARLWCREFIQRRDERARAMATPIAARIYTPCDDGACMVCGRMLGEHDVDIDDGCPANGARTCRVVFP